MWGFIVAIIGGLVVDRAEEPLARPLARLIAPVVRIEQAEMRTLAFAVVMLIVGVIADLIDSGSPFWVILGGVLGLFGVRLFAFARDRLDQRRP
ncbi:MAG: hypothetical protein IT542_09220 [Rubellimicrobium sp.]|nr:hypothetical protein [Rubellimicrobium sp.]